jgi:putative AbiEi antitoxin of type IV toxin-antitoxin system
VVERAIAVLARRQRGYVTRRQLLALGLGSDAIAYRVRVGRLVPVHQGVYAVGHIPALPIDRAYGALLACGPDAVLSHGSAATLWGIRRQWTLPFEVAFSSLRRPRGIIVHRTTVTHRDTRVQQGIRVTSPARTLLDNEPEMSDEQLIRAFNDLRLGKHLRTSELAELLGRSNGNRGTKRLRPLLGSPANPSRSWLEDTFLPFCERHKLPTPQTNVYLLGYEVDAYFEAERLIVELDGYDVHSSKNAFESDRDRDADMAVAEIQTIRVTKDRLVQGEVREARRLHAILAKRRRRP